MGYGKAVLLVLMGACGAVFAAFWLFRSRSSAAAEKGTSPFFVGVGFLTNFFDALGIGSFATTTATWRSRQAVDDRLIPGTLNVGHMLPTVVQAAIFITVVAVDLTTLTWMIAASVAGAWLGAGFVAGLPRRSVRLSMGVLLLLGAGLMLMSLLKLSPSGGDALELHGPLLVIGIAANFVLGALMTLGIGLYAPCMLVVSLLGMNPRAAFPIMMGSCAYLMSAAGIEFVRRGSFDARAALGLTLGGIPGVLIAVYIVKQLPLDMVRWLVVVVVVYTAVSLLRAGLLDKGEVAAKGVSAPVS